MTTKIALSPTKGRMRFWKTAVGVFGVASAGVFADVALRDQGLDTALLIAAIPAAFAGLSALALRSVVSPLALPKLPNRMVSGLAMGTVPYDQRILAPFGAHPSLSPLDDYELSAGKTDTQPDLDDLRYAPSTSAFNWQQSLLDDHLVNPANGMPMVGAVDIEGNAYGFGSLED